MLTAAATILAALLSLIVPTALVIAVILLSDVEPSPTSTTTADGHRAPTDPNAAARMAGSWG